MNASSASSSLEDYDRVNKSNWSVEERDVFWSQTQTNDAFHEEEQQYNSLVIKLSSSLTQLVNESSISLNFESNSVTGITRTDQGGIPSEEDLFSWSRVTGAVFCVLIILSTIFGNTLVVIVVAKFHRMRSVTNILLAR
jgi:hypothetical protein